MEWEAGLAIDYAIASVELAKLAVLHAISSRVEAERTKASQPGQPLRGDVGAQQLTVRERLVDGDERDALTRSGPGYDALRIAFSVLLGSVFGGLARNGAV